jgi:hypothetical protein
VVALFLLKFFTIGVFPCLIFLRGSRCDYFCLVTFSDSMVVTACRLRLEYMDLLSWQIRLCVGIDLEGPRPVWGFGSAELLLNCVVAEC